MSFGRTIRDRQAEDTADQVLKPYTPPIPRTIRILGNVGLIALFALCIVYGFFYALTTPYRLKEFIFSLLPLGFLVIWVLPQTNRAPERAIVGFFWAMYISTLLWPSYLAIALPGLPWISAVRLTGFPLALLLLIAIAQSKSFRSALHDSVRSIPWMMTFQVTFVILNVASVFYSDQTTLSANNTVDNVVGWTCTFFVSAWLFLKPGRAAAFSAWMCIAAVIICLIGVWEVRLQHPVWAGHVPRIFAIEDDFVKRVLAGIRRLGMAYRVVSTQSTPLGLAELLALSTPFFLHFAMGDGYKTWVRVCCVLSLPLVFFVIVETQARLGLVGFFLGALLYVGFWAVKRWRHRQDSLLAPAIVMAFPLGFSALLAASFMIGRIRTRLWHSGTTQASDEARNAMVQQGVPKILSHPWGYGTSTAADVLGVRDPSGMITIDNYYISVGLEWGILGFIVYFGIMLTAIWAAGKLVFVSKMRHPDHTYLIPSAIALTQFVVIKWVLAQPHNHKIIFMMLGMMCALVYRVHHGDAEEAPQQLKQSQPATGSKG